MMLFWRAFVGVNLTPHERALLRFVEGLVGACIIAASTAGVQYLATSTVNGPFVLKLFVGTVLLAAWQAGIKYMRAHADLPLSAPLVAPPKSAAPKPSVWLNDQPSSTQPPRSSSAPIPPIQGPVPPPSGWSANS